MKPGATQFALRETRAFLARGRVLAGLVAAILILAVSGPFGTIDILGPLARAGYWGAVVVLTFSAGVLTDRLCDQWIKRPRLRAVLSVVVTGALATLIVLLLNALVFGRSPFDMASRWLLILQILFVALVVATGLYAMAAGESGGADQAGAPPPLLDRLPLDKRGMLVSISVQDHYVEVVTTRGSALVLMRLTDAIREAGEGAGIRVHRSHWVATDQVQAARREGERAILTMTGGREIPVSRTYLPAIRDAGLLPRGREIK
ncbi:MAG: transcriptional regulator, LytTR family [Rhodobacteraceae bacterium HLUCCO07]|nr:MAG: transcriptional regulator, LytTR family [Rhodobacteraceae bacterium HLUCCO07]